MQCKSIVNLYPHLKPQERVRLFIEAGARGDFPERARLFDSCPMQAWRIVDPAFQRRVDAARHVTTVALIDLVANARCLVGLRAARPLLELLMPPSPTSTEPGDPILEPLETALAKSASGIQNILRGLKEEWLAFEAFCESHFGLKGMQVLQAHIGTEIPAQIAAALEHCKEIEVDEAWVREYREAIESLWRRVSGEKVGES